MYSNKKVFDIKEELAAVSNSVRQKFNALKSGRVEDLRVLEKIYEPLTKPLNVMSKAAYTRSTDVKQESDIMPVKKREPESPNSTKYEGFESARESDDDFKEKVIDDHLEAISHGNKLYDTRYGIHMDKDMKKTMMGNLEVKFSNDNMSFWDGDKRVADYRGNPELYELLFYRDPKKSSDANMQTYKEILEITEAPFKQYKKSKGLSNKNINKLRKIIRPLFPQLGKGFSKIPKYKQMVASKPNYVYWNKPRELVARLRLLWSSKLAGHTGHDNEILSIIEELREERIIY